MQAVGRPPVIPMRTAIFSARCEQLDAMREFVGQAAKDAGMSDDEIYSVQLAVDEACTNIIEHAYGGDSEAHIECTCNAVFDSLTVILRDHGKPFDPSTVPAPDLASDIKKRRVGGLGIFLMRRSMDDVSYESLGEAGNVLTMIKRRKASK